MTIEHLTKDAFFKKVFNYELSQNWKFEGSLPCIIDFYADWCGPCKMVAPILEELSKEYDGKINIYKVDTEAEQELAAAFWHPEHSFNALLPCRGSASDGRWCIAEKFPEKSDQ